MENGERRALEELEGLRAALGCDACLLAVVSGEGGLRWRAAAGAVSERYRRMEERPGTGLSGTVMKIGRPLELQAASLRSARRLQDYPLLIAEELASAYAVPIDVGAGRPAGLLLIGRRGERAFSAAERQSAEASACRLAPLVAEIAAADRPLRPQRL